MLLYFVNGVESSGNEAGDDFCELMLTFGTGQARFEVRKAHAKIRKSAK